MNNVVSHIRQSLEAYYPAGELKSLSMIICRDILGLHLSDIYSGKDNHLSQSEREILEGVIARLKEYEPVQYILGKTDFYGLSFTVCPGVLIPRPETEELIELILNENTETKNILDIGSGSGCIGITLSLHLPRTYVEAWDISTEALAIAEKNNARLNAQVTFLERDVMTVDVVETEKFDIIVSNPPYVTESEKKDMDANVLNWEPSLALFVPDNDPLRFYRRIAELGQTLLTPQGRLYFEINRAYATEVESMLAELNYKHIKIHKDLFKNDRIITACR